MDFVKHPHVERLITSQVDSYIDHYHLFFW